MPFCMRVFSLPPYKAHARARTACLQPSCSNLVQRSRFRENDSARVRRWYGMASSCQPQHVCHAPLGRAGGQVPTRPRALPRIPPADGVAIDQCTVTLPMHDILLVPIVIGNPRFCARSQNGPGMRAGVCAKYTYGFGKWMLPHRKSVDSHTERPARKFYETETPSHSTSWLTRHQLSS